MKYLYAFVIFTGAMFVTASFVFTLFGIWTDEGQATAENLLWSAFLFFWIGFVLSTFGSVAFHEERRRELGI